MDILKAITSREHQFSKGQRAIADYIIRSYDKAAFLTASALGKLTGVSESTVVRFAAELGYDGYPSMQKALQELVRTKLTSVQRTEGAGGPISTWDMTAMVLQADMDAMQATNEQLDRDVLDRAVEALLAARNIYVAGVYTCRILADFLAFHLHTMLGNVRLIADCSAYETVEQLAHLGKRDVVITVSFGQGGDCAAARLCRSVGAVLIAIADSVQAPAAQGAACCLLAQSSRVLPASSLVAPLSLINILLAAVGHRREAEVAGTYARLERVRDEWGL